MERESTLFKMFGKYYPQGTILFKENDPGDEMYYIKSGAIRVTDGSGSSEVVNIIGPGEMLGEEALTETCPRSVMAEVVEDSRLLVIDFRNLGSVVRNGPELSVILMNEIIGRLDRGWKELRSWQQSFFLKKMEIFLRSVDKGRGWTIAEASRETGVEETGVERIVDLLVSEGCLARSGKNCALVDLAVIERLTEAKD
jgi:signal-transduction protein with cAMP-binding, CBS, and nucleotidyltransferase domain